MNTGLVWKHFMPLAWLLIYLASPLRAQEPNGSLRLSGASCSYRDLGALRWSAGTNFTPGCAGRPEFDAGAIAANGSHE